MSLSPFSEFDCLMMQRALALAAKGRYSTKPNPAVGCVIVRDKQVLAEGWHQKAGAPHAERVALAQANERDISVEGATVYVTLEPCSHFGRTPPCADALVAEKVGRVVIAMQDPNPLVAGNGIKLLRNAGIQVDVGLMESEAKSLNKGFIYSMENQRPFVRLKMAASLDGRTAMESGESHWITGEGARLQVHQMRAQHGAVITGIGTVLADNPSLNVRLPESILADMNLSEENCHPIRVVLDAHLSMPLDAKMLSLPGRTIIVSSKETFERSSELVEAFHQQGAELVAVAAEGDKLDLASVLDYLHNEEQIREVMVEAGASVAGAFIQAGLVNEIHTYIAPILMGNMAKPMFALPGLQMMADKIQLRFQSIEQVGEDLHLVLVPKP